MTHREERAAQLKAFSLVVGENSEIFHNADREPFITVAVDTHRENYPLVAKGSFRNWCEFIFFRNTGLALPEQLFKEVLAQLQAQATYDAPEFQTPLRVSENKGTIYLDLCDPEWRSVEISGDGWEVVTDPPVRFRRTPGMSGLPVPVRGGDVKELFQFINIKTEEHQVLTLAWLLAALRPTGPYPIFALHGAQGSAKTTTERILRQLIDPAKTMLSGVPRDERDLLISAKHSHLLGFDNFSSVSDFLSDALCRIATGSGLATRKLYTDDTQMLFNSCRPILLNGISDIATRGDLLDRMIILHLPKIAKKERREEREINREFEAAQPKILGALLSAVSTALKSIDKVSLVEKPRMADFAVWAVAGAQALGFSKKVFLAAYDSNRIEANFIALENSPAAVEIRRWLSQHGEWTGTCGELLAELNQTVSADARRDPAWPKSAKAMSLVMARSGPNLAAVGLNIKQLPREAGTGRRNYHLTFRAPSQRARAENAKHVVACDGVTVRDEDGIAA